MSEKNNQEIYNVNEGVSMLTVIHKNGLDEQEPISIQISGNIDSPLNWLQKRVVNVTMNENSNSTHIVLQLESHLLIDRNNLSIMLVLNETNPLLKGYILGKLEKHPDFLKWNINNPSSDWDHDSLSEFIKMNRSFFTDRNEAMKLSTALKELKVKVDKELEKYDDKKGNYRNIAVQTVKEMSIPAEFSINVPIFKGQNKVSIAIEIYINPNNYRITLVSPDANDVVSDVRDSIINDQKSLIADLAPDIVIIEQ